MNNPIRILLVDDSPYFLEAARDFLQHQEAMSVTGVAVNAEEAVARARDLQPDVILLDLNLARGSGLDLIPVFREILPGAKIVVLTMMEQFSYRAAALGAGADDFIPKSDMINRLAAVIYGLMGRVEPASSSARSNGAARRGDRDFQITLDDISELICRFLPDGTLTYVNEAYCRYFGKSREELIGSNFISSAADDFPQKLREHFQSFTPGQPVAAFEQYDILPNGERRWREWVDRAFFDQEGRVIEFQSAGRDITERKLAEARIQRQMDYLTALAGIDRVILSGLDMRVTLDFIAVRAASLLNADAVSVLLLDPKREALEYGAGVGFYTEAILTSSVRVGESYAKKVAQERRLVQIPDLSQEPHHLFSRGFLKDEHFVSYYGAPLIVKGRVVGVLEAFNRSYAARDEEWLNFLGALAGQAAIAIDNARLFENLQNANAELALAYEATIEGWSRALDLRDQETEGHTQRVTERALELARRMGFSAQELVHLRYGALLHDIGKMGVPDEILFKPGALTEDEWTIMRKHPVFARDLLAPIHYLRAAAIEIPYSHHERWDGSGYPLGLKGGEIPLSARIFAVVDVFDALTSHRPYRPAWSKEKALEHIRSLSGVHFDPQVVEVFLEMMK